MARARKIRVTEAAWKQRPLPSVDERRCSGCGWCAAACPVGCLAMRGASPHLVRPADCVSCGLCAEVCPKDAIAMIRSEPEA